MLAIPVPCAIAVLVPTVGCKEESLMSYFTTVKIIHFCCVKFVFMYVKLLYVREFM